MTTSNQVQYEAPTLVVIGPVTDFTFGSTGIHNDSDHLLKTP
jgi:hypothetical protein